MALELRLDEEEASLLIRVLRNRFDDLRGEVHHTRDQDGREYLLHKERILRRILDKIPEEHDAKAHMKGFTKR